MYFKSTSRASFYIYLSALIMLFSFLVIDLITAIYFPFGVAKSLEFGEKVSHYYSFFTTQSNYLVAFYFSFFLYYSYFKKTTPTFVVRLTVTIYISLTMLVFWLGIFTKSQDSDQYGFYGWIHTIILHLIMPVIMITNFIFTSGQEKIDVKKWHQNYLWLIALYPAVYSTVILIRGHLRFLDKKCSKTLYPYFFFNYTQPYGWLIAASAIVIIFGLVFGLQYFYIWINNLMFKKNYKKKQFLKEYYSDTISKLNKQKDKN